MTFSVEQMGWLLTACIVLAVLGAILLLSRRHSRWWRTVCIALPLSATALIALGLSNPRGTWNPVASRVVLLLDWSGSTRNAPWRVGTATESGPAWVRKLAEARLGPHTRVDIIAFGDVPLPLATNLKTSDPRAWPSTWDAATGPGSNLDAALQWRASENDRDPRWIITDGLIVSNQMPFSQSAITTVSADRVDMGITQIRLAGPAIWLEIRATGPSAGVLEVRQNDKILATQPITFDPSPGSGGARGGEKGDGRGVPGMVNPGMAKWIKIDRPPHTPQPTSYSARVTLNPSAPRPGDPWPENDSAEIRWVPEEQSTLQMLFLGRSGDSLPPSTPDVTLTQAPIETISTSSADEWTRQGYQVLVLTDVPTRSDDQPVLSPEAAAAIADFATSSGGGVIIRGAKHAFGPGGYAEANAASRTLESLSAVWSREPDQGTDVVLVLDASASMNEDAGGGQSKFARIASAVVSAAEQLQPQDHLSVLVFSGQQPRTVATGPVSTVRPALPDLLAAIKPAGGTNPDFTLPDVARALTSPRQKKVLVFLTDGEIPTMDSAAWAKITKDTQTTMTILAPNTTRAGVAGQLAKATNARWMGFSDSSEWRSLLMRAVAEPLVGNLQSQPTSWTTLNDPPNQPALTGETSPWVRVWKKDEATLRAVATSDKSDHQTPLAAIAQRGLGKVASIAMIDDALTLRLAREVAGQPGDRRFTVSASRDKDTWRIRVEGKDATGFLNGEKITLRIDGRQLQLPQIGPGLYAENVPALGPAVGILTRLEGDTAKFVGIVRMPNLPATEWPASMQDPKLPQGPPPLVILSSDPAENQRWQPREQGATLHLQSPLVAIGILLALAALWLRQLSR